MKLYVLKGSHGSNNWIAHASMNMELLEHRKMQLESKQSQFFIPDSYQQWSIRLGSTGNKEAIEKEMHPHDPKYSLERHYNIAAPVYYEIEEVEILE